MLVLTCAIETLTCAIGDGVVAVLKLLLTSVESCYNNFLDVGCVFFHESLTFAKRF